MRMSRTNKWLAILSAISIHLPPTIGWGFNIIIDPNPDIEDPAKLAEMTRTIKATAHRGAFRWCTKSQGDWTGFRISQYGLYSESTDDRDQLTAPRWEPWKNSLRWMGFWQNSNCGGLPNLIVHYYDAPYTNQAIVFKKLENWISGITHEDWKFGSNSEIPLGDVWFSGDNYIPEGAVAIRIAARKKQTVVTEAEFTVVEDAVAVQAVGPNGNSAFISAEDRADWIGSGRVEGPPWRVKMKIEPGVELSTAAGDYDKAVKLAIIPDIYGVRHQPPPENTNLKEFLGGDYYSLVVGESDATPTELEFFFAQDRRRNEQEAYEDLEVEFRRRPEVLFPGLSLNTKKLTNMLSRNYVESYPDWDGLTSQERARIYFSDIKPMIAVLREVDARRDRGESNDFGEGVDRDAVWDLILGTKDRDQEQMNDLRMTDSEKVWDLVLGTKDWFHLDPVERHQRLRWMLERLKAPTSRPLPPKARPVQANPLPQPVTQPQNSRPQNSQRQQKLPLQNTMQQAGSRNTQQLAPSGSNLQSQPLVSMSQSRSLPDRMARPMASGPLLSYPPVQQQYNLNYNQQQNNLPPFRSQNYGTPIFMSSVLPDFAQPNQNYNQWPPTSNNNQQPNSNFNQQQNNQNIYDQQFQSMPYSGPLSQYNSNANQPPNINNNQQQPPGYPYGGMRSMQIPNVNGYYSSTNQVMQNQQPYNNGPLRSLNAGNLPPTSSNPFYQGQPAPNFFQPNFPQRPIDRLTDLNGYSGFDPAVSDLFNEGRNLERDPFSVLPLFQGQPGNSGDGMLGRLGFVRMEEETNDDIFFDEDKFYSEEKPSDLFD
ncbi:hypothetical protein AA313_de0207047 [Arthrobotrys entomopaga]|nr:hypothetical protein AA313_de0207047 [Arthrobotrys entomopaga]